MNTLKEYIEKKDELLLEDEINEDAMSVISNIFGYTTAGLAAAFGATLLISGGITAIKGLKKLWQNIFKKTREIFNPNKVAREMKIRPEVRKVEEQIKQSKRKYEDELKQVYLAIGQKDFDTAGEEYNMLEKTLQDNPDVIKTVVADISRVMEQPPVYITSPGNKTYQAIKKVLNIRVARAAAKATEMAMSSMAPQEDEK